MFLAEQKKNVQKFNYKQQRITNFLDSTFGGLVPAGACTKSSSGDSFGSSSFRAFASSTDTAMGSICSLFDQHIQGNNKFTVTSGNCIVSSTNCVSSPNYPNSNYPNSDSCSIQVTDYVDAEDVILVNAFQTGATHDTLVVKGVSYSGTTAGGGPVGVKLVSGDTVSWSTDTTVTKSGWEICLGNSEWSTLPSKPIGDTVITTVLATSSRVQSYSMQAPSTTTSDVARTPLRWTVEAQLLRDGSWVVVDDQYSTVDAPAWSLAEVRSYALPSAAAFRSYGWRIRVHAVGTGGDRVQLSQLQWFSEDVTRSTTLWPSTCDDTGTSSLSYRDARIVRAYDRAAAFLAQGKTNSDYVDQLFRSDVHDSVLRRYSENTFGSAKGR